MARHIVRQGESLARIASRYHVPSAQALYDMQPQEFRRRRPNPALIYPGDVLHVPDPPGSTPSGQPVLTAQQQVALNAVAAFRSRAQPQAFTSISRARVADGLAYRVRAPSTIDQGSSSLCGPSSMLYILARSEPQRYVQFVTDLYENGTATLGTLTIAPSADLRAYDPGNAVHPADWIPAASIRDSENALFDYDEVSDEFAGITLPGDLVKWLRALGFTVVEDRTSLSSTQDFQNLLAAGVEREKGYWVFLFINANMLSTSSQTASSWTPDHWVVLRSSTIGRQNVRLDIFTWGQRRSVPASGTLSTADCLKNYYGYVKCKY